MTGRQWVAAAATVVIAGSAVATGISAVGHASTGVRVEFVLATLFIGTVFAGLGDLLVAERPRNLLGPLLFGSGAALVIQMALRELADAALQSPDSAPTWAILAGWCSAWLDVLGLPLPLAVALLLFPDGRLAGRLWWPVLVAAVTVGAVRMAVLMLTSGPIDLASHDIQVPWHGPIPHAAGTHLDAIMGQVVIAVLLAAIGSVIARFVRGSAEMRQRLKPLLLALVVIVAGLLLQTVDSLHDVGVAVFVLGGASVPLALTIGVLRYRLWDLDPFLVRSIVYGGLAFLVAAVYVAVVQVVDLLLDRSFERQNLVPSILATAVVAVSFAPAQRRLEQLARRVVFGSRATPYETLTALPHRLVDTPEVDRVLPAIAQTISQGFGATAAAARVQLGDGGEVVAWQPGRPENSTGSHSAAVRHLGTTIGELVVVPSATRPLGKDDLRLLRDLAAQAGPALKSVALTAELTQRLAQITMQSEELAASRKRLAIAHGEERVRLQRNLHDGAQQRLVALAMQLGAIRMHLGTHPQRAITELVDASANLDACLDEIREISRGLHPAMLEASGLVAALRSRAAVARDPVHVVAPGLDGKRFPAEVEDAAYYCCLEALQNAAKHAPGATVTLTLCATEHTLRWTVADTGPGMPPVHASYTASGIVGMRDRLTALGGTLDISSSPNGTVVAGRLPLT